MKKKVENTLKILGIVSLSIFGLIFLIWFFIGFGEIDKEILEQIEESVVWVKYEYAEKWTDGSYLEREASGSGVLINEDNKNYYILTNRHVVDCGYWVEEVCWERLWEKIQIRTRDGRFHEVTEILYAPHELDIVQLTIEKKVGDHYQVVEYLNEALEGEYVIAVGYPVFSDKTLEFSVSGGYVTGFRELMMDDGFTFEVIDSDAYTNFGSSGGGLFDAYGSLLGINTWADEYEGYAIDYYFIDSLGEEFFFCEEGYYFEGDACIEKCAGDEIRSIKDGECYKESSSQCENSNLYCEAGYCYKNQCFECPVDTYLYQDGECYYNGTKEKPFG